MPRHKKLQRSFFDRDTLVVARECLGKYLIYNSSDVKKIGRIVETEAYIGKDDPACHASRGRTKRNEIMFGPAGFAYIYFIYGMYHCLNFVTEREGLGAAVLIRAVEPVSGFGGKEANSLTNGPGKLCRAFDLTREQNGVDLTGRLLYLEDRSEAEVAIESSSRIGIRSGTDLPWRFFDTNSGAVSGMKKSKV